MNGGMQRCFHIMHQLARHFDLTAIIHQDKKSFLKCVDEFPAMATAKIFSTKEVSVKDAFSLFPRKWENAFRSRWYQRELNRPADGSLIKYYPVLSQLLKEKKFDAIILENVATLNAVKIIRRYDKKVKIIYNAHNVDTNLAEAALHRKEITSSELKSYHNVESNLYKKVNAIFTCSTDDRDIFDQMNHGRLNIAVVPNGVTVPEKKYNSAVKQQIPRFLLFCGSLWSIPNAEGLQWFCKKIWPQILHAFPGLKLLVVGIGELPEKYSEVYSIPSIEFTGAVDDVKPYYNKAAVSIAPLLTGSGTRLKILEAMGMGVPVVSTRIGAEGITYTDGKDILIADSETEFAEKIFVLLKDKEQRLQIQGNANENVIENYDWNVIGKSMAEFIIRICSPLKTLKLNFGYFWPSFNNYDNYFTSLLSKRYHIEISDDPDFYIFTHPYYNGKKDYLNYKCHKIFFGFENVRADWDACDYVFDPDYSDNPRHKRYPFWCGYDIKKLTLSKDVEQFKKKEKFCCMVVSNPNAKERIDFFYQLSEYKKVDSGGKYLNNIDLIVENKKEFIKDYKFVISFENSSHPGYTTEKLIEPMLVDSIPIYWGNPAAGNDFNTKSFVNVNDFRTFEDAIKYIIELDQNEEKYLEMAAQPWFIDNKIPDELTEESILDFFDFIVKDSKKRRPIARSRFKKFKEEKDHIKNYTSRVVNSFRKSFH